MIDNGPKSREAGPSGATTRRFQSGVLGAVCVLVVGIYAVTAQSGLLESLSLNPADAYYNLLVQGFRSGQLSLKKDVPPGLAQLADPYDPMANGVYRTLYWMYDLSYYKGRFHLYFGVTPALILFWPFAALTGRYLFQRQAVVIFCAIGFLASVGLLRALWRRYFAEVHVGVLAACALALGLATGVPVMLTRCDVYEASISCGYMLTMLALAAIGRTLFETRRGCLWLAGASLAYGLALGARPSLVFGAVILLVPVVRAWHERRPIGGLLVAATVPIIVIGLGLMIYNSLRFDNPLEFGVRYQLSGRRQDTVQRFGLHYLWFNFRIYFLEPARWTGRFPFVRDIAVPPLPAGYATIEHPFGVLTNFPLVWLALAAPLAWRGRAAETRSILRWFTMTLVLLFGICALTAGLYFGGCIRYEVEFVPVLVLLAVVGILGLERVWAPISESGQASTSESGRAGWPFWRRAARWGWSLLLAFSVAVNLLASVGLGALAGSYSGVTVQEIERLQEAIAQYEQALRIKPDSAEAHYNLEIALARTSTGEEAIGHYQQALRIKPDSAEAKEALARLRGGQ